MSNYRQLKSLVTFREQEDDDSVIWAVKDVDLEIERGDVVGLIGANGAGKSTLLKIISRITTPTTGRITIDGRVSSLLEVGTGFHPDLTGRENVYLNATILGMKKREVDRKFEEIVAFSGIEKFIDTPIKRYSSGMKMRLAFSVAAHLDPDILIVDEVLAVGDAAFQRKCLGKMEDVSSHGRTVVFVSHNLGMVRSLCATSVVMDCGRLAYRGPVGEGIAYYLHDLVAGREDSTRKKSASATSSGIHDARINNVVASKIPTVAIGKPFSVGATLQLAQPATAGGVVGTIEDSQGATIAMVTHELGNLQKGSYSLQVSFPPLWLAPGSYQFQFKFGCNSTRKDLALLVSEPLVFDSSGAVSEITKRNAKLAPAVEWTFGSRT